MTVKVRENKKWGFVEYDIYGEYPDGEPYRLRRKSHLTSLTATLAWAKNKEREMLESWRAARQAEYRPPTLREAYDEYMKRSHARKNADGTIAWKKLMWAHISRHIPETTRVDKISMQMVDDLMRGIVGKEKSINNVLDVFLGILRYAQKQGKLVHLPMVDKLKVPEQAPKHLVLDAYERFLEAARELEAEGIWEPLAVGLLGAGSGLRRGEMLALHQKSIDFDGRRIIVEHSYYKKKIVTTKGKRFRVVGMDEETARVLKAHRHLRGPLLFYHQRRGWPVVPATPHIIYKWFALACDRANLSVQGKVHVLRHTFGTHHAEAGTDMHRLQALMGHADQRTTEIYARIAAKAALEATSRLEAYREDRRRAREEDRKTGKTKA